MQQKLVLLLTLIAFSCSTPVEKPSSTPVESKNSDATAAKEFAKGEVILATEMLVKIFDKEMGPIDCVPDHEEASLLLRTIRPRMEVVEDDLEAMLDDKDEVKKLIESCHENCTCNHLDDLLREHLVELSKDQKKIMMKNRSKSEKNRCMTYAQQTFCQSELYKALSIEKADFSFDEGDL